jgi:hypothetical protein
MNRRLFDKKQYFKNLKESGFVGEQAEFAFEHYCQRAIGDYFCLNCHHKTCTSNFNIVSNQWKDQHTNDNLIFDPKNLKYVTCIHFTDK